MRIDLQSLAAKNKRSRKEQEPAYVMRSGDGDGAATGGEKNGGAKAGGSGGVGTSYDTVLKDVEQILFGAKGVSGKKL